jgi:hypothetical protein
MPGLVPAIHVLAAKEDVDGRDKPAMTNSNSGAMEVL